MANGCFLTVVNATNLKIGESREYFELAEKWGVTVVVLSIKPPSESEFLVREDSRRKFQGRHVPLAAFQRQAKLYENCTLAYKQHVEALGGKFIELDDVNLSELPSAVVEIAVSTRIQQPEFFELDEPKEWYAIADIHGCIDELKQLHQICIADAASLGRQPVFIQLGDILDRGPDSFAALDYCHQHFDYNIMGNHEWLFLREVNGAQHCRSSSRKLTHAAFAELDDVRKADILKKIKSRKAIVTMYIGETYFVFTHSPVKDFAPFFKISNIKDVAYNSALPDYERSKLFVAPCPTVNVYGHQSWKFADIDEQKSQQVGNLVKHFNLDSGCVYGGKLTAMRIRDEAVFQVSSGVNVAPDVFDKKESSN
jgi:serine/threonine protein phosphatase 1